MRTLSLFVVIASAVVGARGAEQTGNSLVRPEMLADVAMIRPGQTFTLGVMFRIEPSWHIYWKNSGESGSPTVVTFAGPAGFEISEVRWPAPRRFVEEGPIINFGYAEQVMLSAKVTAPKDLKVGQKVRFSAKAQWLVCKDRCLTGEGNVELAMGVGEETAAANTEVFTKVERELPVDIESVQSPLRAKMTGAIPADARKGDFAIEIAWAGEAGKDMDFFPDPESALVIDDIRVNLPGGETGRASGPRITFKATVLRGKSLKSPRLPAVVAFTDATGVRRSVSLNVPLRTATP